MQRFEKQIYKEQLSAIAFTQGPGLMGSLLVEVHLQNLLHWL
jgi:tRNA A37 threonylcarbamoyltransferase TsaD